MKKEKLRVFHGLVNYGTQSGFYAKELQKCRINALSVTGYDSFARITDITLKNSGRNLLEKIYNYIWNNLYLIKCFFLFNVFHFYFGKSLSRFQLDLPFYHFFGKKVIFHYLGLDVQLYQSTVEKYKINNVHFIFDAKSGKKHDRIISKRLNFEKRFTDLQMVCAPCYSEFVHGSIVLPLAIDLNEYIYSPRQIPENDITIMHAPTSRNNKGTSFILDAIDRLIKEGYKINMLLIENISHQQLKEKYKECDIFVDQIVAGWYGTASIEAMAIGRVTVCFLRESYFEHINFGATIPIVNADPDNIYEVLKQLINEKEKLPLIGEKSRIFVEKEHNLKLLTEKLISIYLSL